MGVGVERQLGDGRRLAKRAQHHLVGTWHVKRPQSFVQDAREQRVGCLGRRFRLECDDHDKTAFIRVKKSPPRSEEHTSELQSLMRISYAVFCLKKKNNK